MKLKLFILDKCADHIKSLKLRRSLPDAFLTFKNDVENES